MDSVFIKDILIPSGTAGIALVSMGIAWYASVIANKGTNNTELKTLLELHSNYWTSEYAENIMNAVSYNNPYNEIQKILNKRERNEDLNKEEYHKIYEIDKFLNFMNLIFIIEKKVKYLGKKKKRYKYLPFFFKEETSLADEMFVPWWLKRSVMRDELFSYIRTHYGKSEVGKKAIRFRKMIDDNDPAISDGDGFDPDLYRSHTVKELPASSV